MNTKKIFENKAAVERIVDSRFGKRAAGNVLADDAGDLVTAVDKLRWRASSNP
jgi:hypothetical protein